MWSTPIGAAFVQLGRKGAPGGTAAAFTEQRAGLAAAPPARQKTPFFTAAKFGISGVYAGFATLKNIMGRSILDICRMFY